MNKTKLAITALAIVLLAGAAAYVYRAKHVSVAQPCWAQLAQIAGAKKGMGTF